MRSLAAIAKETPAGSEIVGMFPALLDNQIQVCVRCVLERTAVWQWTFHPNETQRHLARLDRLQVEDETRIERVTDAIATHMYGSRRRGVRNSVRRVGAA